MPPPDLIGPGLRVIFCGTAPGTASERAAAFDADRLLELLERHRPTWIAFTGKRAAAEALGRKPIAFGVQPELFGGCRVYALPSTSGAASGYWDESHWRTLAGLLPVAVD